jgi:hypothetical protein
VKQFQHRRIKTAQTKESEKERNKDRKNEITNNKQVNSRQAAGKPRTNAGEGMAGTASGL